MKAIIQIIINIFHLLHTFPFFHSNLKMAAEQDELAAEEGL